ncbi:hypothetical protein GCM10022231_27510 [Gordonia caeni]|uniref:Uncharacterized protein n=1 Tax=Gordonia caeni TaxID=1007097 RepID=A0ABP7PGL3_9ACTN
MVGNHLQDVAITVRQTLGQARQLAGTDPTTRAARSGFGRRSHRSIRCPSSRKLAADLRTYGIAIRGGRYAERYTCPGV